ncbi:MAG TPA: BlaI/MecI/CopY family transcriptional regulator [Terriglobia bacterium]|nr:BlaI/MecI/CopY family transcriptional regulator [Terriglobia bacterium]
MTPRKPSHLTEAELRIMNIVWMKEKATVADVTASLPRDLNLAYNTVLTTMRILEKKGFLKHAKAKEARAFVYRPVVGRMDATRSAVRHLLRRFFGDSAGALVLNLLEDDVLDETELKSIRKLLQEKGVRK